MRRATSVELKQVTEVTLLVEDPLVPNTPQVLLASDILVFHLQGEADRFTKIVGLIEITAELPHHVAVLKDDDDVEYVMDIEYDLTELFVKGTMSVLRVS
jgi:hypothetical protein